MRLYNLNHSPYATRVRMVIAKKQLPIEIIDPPLALRTPEFLQNFPLGKIPLLELDNKDCLPESIAIIEFLEEQFPNTPCMPKTPNARAFVRVLMAFTDTNLGPAFVPFFKALLVPGFVFNAQEQVAVVLESLSKLNKWLHKYHTQDGKFTKSAIDLGDIALTPTLWCVKTMLPNYSEQDAFEGLTTLNEYWQWVQKDDAVKSELDAMAGPLTAFIKSKQVSK